MKIRRMIWVALMVLPFLALGTHADSLSPLEAGAANALLSQTQSDSLDGSSAALGTTTLLEENLFAARLVFTNNGNPWCRRVFVQGGINSMGCGFPGFGGKPIFIPEPGEEAVSIPDLQSQTAAVPDPSTFLLVATGLLGGAVRLRKLMPPEQMEVPPQA